MDFGASHHVIGSHDNLYEISASHPKYNVTTTNGNAHHIERVGSSSVNTRNSNGINIGYILYVPALKKNLLSVGSLADQGHTIAFTSNDCLITIKTRLY